MKISRRGLFGLGAGAAVVPFVKPAEAAPVFKHVAYGAYTNDFGMITVCFAKRELTAFEVVGPDDVEF